jgi:hypothetical protein
MYGLLLLFLAAVRAIAFRPSHARWALFKPGAARVCECVRVR